MYFGKDILGYEYNTWTKCENKTVAIKAIRITYSIILVFMLALLHGKCNYIVGLMDWFMAKAMKIE